MTGSDEAASSGSAPSAITAGHVRAARGLLGWTTAELAAKGGTDAAALTDFEAGRRDLPSGQIAALRSVLMAAGVAFTNGTAPGVKLERGGTDEGTRLENLTTENDR